MLIVPTVLVALLAGTARDVLARLKHKTVNILGDVGLNNDVPHVMAKKRTIAQEVEKAAVLLQKLVRLNAANELGFAHCVTCGCFKHWKQLQGGHFISRGHLSTKLTEENVHPQCQDCNAFKMKDNLTILEYRRFMVDMYGDDEVKAMEQLARQPKKYNRAEVADIVADFKVQIKRHEERLKGF
mgnify:CR=1 FL=1